jgi:hypothetical protein
MMATDSLCIECGREEAVKDGLCNDCFNFLGENHNVAYDSKDIEETLEQLEEVGEDETIFPPNLPVEKREAYLKFLKYEQGQTIEFRTVYQTVKHKYHCQLCNSRWTEDRVVPLKTRRRTVADRYSLRLELEHCGNCMNTLLLMEKKDLIIHFINYTRDARMRWRKGDRK